MNRDNVYIFDKITFKRQLLGEIEKDINMSFVIDGTKDNAKILVWSFVDYEIEPYTILWHENTNTWWSIKHDKIERYENENGFYYVHNIELVGAIEIFNARDLIDCAFNEKTYTVGEFIRRLFSLSNLEFAVELDESDYNFLIQRVDFIKTFENYTLLSALREFLDAYNECGKLTFTTFISSGNTYIQRAYLNIISKTGSNKYDKHDISDFNDVRETKVLDKDNFGTCVVSNANNVVSSQSKTYPAIGMVGLSSEEYDITTDNALLRLPTNIHTLNWIKLVSTIIDITIHIVTPPESPFPTIDRYIGFLVYDNDQYSIEQIRNFITTTIKSDFDNGYITQENYEWLVNNVELIWKRAKEYHTITFYNGVQYNPNNTFTKPNYVPYIPVFESTAVGGTPQEIALLTKDVRDCKDKVDNQIFAIYWERGSNLIRGFNFLNHNHRIRFDYTDGYYLSNSHDAMIYQSENSDLVVYGRDTSGNNYIDFQFKYEENGRNITLFRINYIPMADLKLKVDNQRNKHDIHLYNQNGKLSDSYALSKLINSYAKEISSDSITRYAQYFDFDSVPKVGSFVNKGNDLYVINNVSMTFYQNENTDNEFGYFIDCEFSMSKWCSTKSAMVSPNTNIRDYGIPQQYNVKRKQVYRDYYELSYELYDDSNIETPYIPMDYALPFSHNYESVCNFACHIRLEYEEELSGELYWYYQLECTTIVCGKQIISVCDFKDNNIIGYSAMNRAFIFDVSHLFDQYARINTPISYVDDYGKFKGIDIVFLNENQRMENDAEYLGGSSSYDALLTQCFIPQELFEISQDNNSFTISEQEYYKDPLEVPFFEYCFQVGDSDYVLFGDNVLMQRENYVYFYSYVRGKDFNQSNVFNTSNHVEPDQNYTVLELYDGVDLIYGEINGEKVLKVGIYLRQIRRNSDNQFVNQTKLQFATGYDYAIFKHSYNLETNEEIVELAFIIKNVPSSSIGNDDYLVLYQNNYKLN